MRRSFFSFTKKLSLSNDFKIAFLSAFDDSLKRCRNFDFYIECFLLDNFTLKIYKSIYGFLKSVFSSNFELGFREGNFEIVF